MKKLIAIVITLIFIFDNAGYCLRVPMNRARLLKSISKLPEGKYNNEFIIRYSVLVALDSMEKLMTETENHQDEDKAIDIVRKVQGMAHNLTAMQLLTISQVPDLVNRYNSLDGRVDKFKLALPYTSVVNKPGIWVWDDPRSYSQINQSI